MESPSQPPIPLFLAGTPGCSRATLKRGVDSARLLRIKPGVCARLADLVGAARSRRHLLQVAAIAISNPAAVFRSVSALNLHGLPLLHSPGGIHMRVGSSGRVGTAPTQSLTGRAQKEELRAALMAADQGTYWDRLNSLPEIRRAYPQRGTFTSSDPGAEPAALVTRIAPEQVPVPGVESADGSPVLAAVEPMAYALAEGLPDLSPEAAVVPFDAALAGRSASGRSVASHDLDLAEKVLIRTRRRTATWHWMREFADARAESPGESRVRVLLHELGFAPPRLQHELVVPQVGCVRPDFYWPEVGVICEFDGRVKYMPELAGQSPESVVWHEKRREDGLRLMGLMVVRLTWSDLEDREAMTRMLLRAGVPHRFISAATR